MGSPRLIVNNTLYRSFVSVIYRWRSCFPWHRRNRVKIVCPAGKREETRVVSHLFLARNTILRGSVQTPLIIINKGMLYKYSGFRLTFSWLITPTHGGRRRRTRRTRRFERSLYPLLASNKYLTETSLQRIGSGVRGDSSLWFFIVILESQRPS